MANLSAEQAEFIRKNGVTRCPPGPTFRVYWGWRRRGNNALGRGASEDEIIARFAAPGIFNPYEVYNHKPPKEKTTA